MPSPVRLTQHAEPDNAIQWWLKHFSMRTPGTKAASNATARLSVDEVPQPDALEAGLSDPAHAAFVQQLGARSAQTRI